MKALRYAGALLSALALGSALHAAPALAGQKALNGQTLDAEAVKAVLLGKKITLGDTRVVLVIAKTSEAQEQFLQRTVGMSTSQFQSHWRRLFMTGGGTAPKVVENEAEAIAAAAATPGGIAIVEESKAESLAILAKS